MPILRRFGNVRERDRGPIVGVALFRSGQEALGATSGYSPGGLDMPVGQYVLQLYWNAYLIALERNAYFVGTTGQVSKIQRHFLRRAPDPVL